MSEPADVPSAGSLRAIALRWAVLAVAALLVFAGIVAALNSTLYSASGFVRSYLAALARGDVSTALETPGVAVPEGASRQALTREALGPLGGVEVLGEESLGEGVYRVEAAATLGEERVETAFVVQTAPPRLGVFSSWRFVQSPLATLAVTPLRAGALSIGGAELVAEAPLGEPTPFAVFAPGAYPVSQSTEYAVAPERRVLVADGGTELELPLDALPTAALEETVQEALDEDMAACAEQEVLQPTGCPFGERIVNRIDAAPEWSITEYPEAALEPGDRPGTWTVTAEGGIARLEVPVRSIYDGTLEQLEEDIPFRVAYDVRVDAEGAVTVLPAG